MPLDSKRRRDLAAQGQRLKALVTISVGDPSTNVVQHVRNLLTDRELAKVRVQADSADEAEAVARRLAEVVPCEVVNRVGRVILFYKPPQSSASTPDQVGQPG